jgi:PAS domain S-box-containing protein
VAVPDGSVFSAFLEKVFAGQAQEVCEVAIRGERKGPLNLQITATVSQDGSECRLMMADISKLRQAQEVMRHSERRYRSFVEVTSQWAWVTDTSGQVVEDIPALRKFTGQTYEQAKGAGWAAALHPEDRQHTLEVWNRAVSTQTPYEIEYRMRRHDGVYRQLLARGVPILDEQGHVVEWVGTCIDITERKQAEEELRQLNLNLEQRVVERTSALAHTVEVLQGEIRQRVHAEYELKLANEQLIQRADQLRRLAGQLTMTEQTERKRISKILHDGLQQLLFSAKLQIGGLGKRIGNVEIKQEIDEVEKLIGDSVRMSRSLSAELCPAVLYESGLSDGLRWLARWMQDKHRLRVDFSIEAVPELREDARVLMFESVREMLFNTLKHAQASSVRVSLEQADGGGLRIIVSDEGVGFDPSRLNPAGQDSGFGLFSIRERISLIGGKFEIESALGKGSRFTLNVPYSQAVFVPSQADEVCTLPGPSPKGIVADQGLLWRYFPQPLTKALTKPKRKTRPKPGQTL